MEEKPKKPEQLPTGSGNKQERKGENNPEMGKFGE